MIQFKNKDFTVFESQLFKTTSTVIQTPDCVIIVDPNWLQEEVKTIKEYVNEIKQDRAVYLLFTHSDWDHILGYGAFLDATIIGSKALEECQEKEEIVEQVKSFDDKYYIDRNYPILFPKVDVIVQEDGQVLKIGSTTLTFYKANGHTNDGIFTIIEPLGIWISGDYLSDVEFPYIYSSSLEYEKTLGKVDTILEKHDVRFLVPGHGYLTESIDEIQKRKSDSLHYIQELRAAIRSNTDSLHLIESYLYPRGMKAFHEGNVQLIKGEIEGQ